MGREARINKAKQKRDLEAFLATDEGKAALEARDREVREGHARDLASKVLEHAHSRVFERTLAAEVARWSGADLDALLTAAPVIRARALELAEREGVVLRRTAMEIEEVVASCQKQLALSSGRIAETVGSPEDSPNAVAVRELDAITRRGCVLALSNVFARVTVVELEVAQWPAGPTAIEPTAQEAAA